MTMTFFACLLCRLHAADAVIALSVPSVRPILINQSASHQAACFAYEPWPLWFAAFPAAGRREGEGSAPLAPGDPGTADNPFAAVMVLKDPTDWFRDLQLILDVVTCSASHVAAICCRAPSPSRYAELMSALLGGADLN